MRRVVLLLVAGLVVAGCGDEGDGSTDSGRAVTAKTTLSIALTGERSTRAFTLRCDEDGGTWPDAAAAPKKVSGWSS